MEAEVKIVIVIVMVAAVSVIILLLLKTLIKRADKSMHDSVVTQINTYDTIIEEKNMRLAAINARINEADKQLKKMMKDEEQDRESCMLPAEIKEVSFCRNDFISDYKNIKEHFHFNKALLLDVIAGIRESDENERIYKTVCGILDKLNIDLIYHIGTFRAEEQKEIIREILEGSEKDIFSEYESNVKYFRCERFWYYLKSLKNKSSSAIRVNTSDDSTALFEEYIKGKLPVGTDVKIAKDDGLCDGFQVLSSQKLYDYGIRRNELS